MSTQYRAWKTINPGNAAVADPVERSDSAFLRARQILRQQAGLTTEQFRELDDLLRSVNQPQFIALTEDPDHRHQLRSYEALSWNGRLTAILVLLTALLIGALAAIALIVLAR